MRGLALSMLLAFGAMVGAAAPAGTAAAQAAQAPQAISDPALGFTARIPGAASKMVTPGAPDDGLANTTNWIAESGNAAYSVTVLQFRAGAFNGQDHLVLLELALDGGIAAVDGVQTSGQTTTLSGMPALEAQYSSILDGKPMIGRVIMALKGDNLYAVMSLEPEGATDAAFRQMVRDFKLQ